MAEKHILLPHRLHTSCEVALGEKYVVHKLYERADPGDTLSAIGDKIQAIAGSAVAKDLMQRLPNLEIIAGYGVGYDGIDTAAAQRRNIRVTNTPDVLNDAVAELAQGLMISLARRLPQADRFVREGRWSKGSFPLQVELSGKTVGILGLGRIGKNIARRCLGMNMRVIYSGRQKQTNQPYIFYDDRVDMARDADWLVVITSGGEGTKGLVSRPMLEALGADGYLVNLSRGSVVDEAALIDLLQSGGLAGAALDVFADEPHVPDALRTLDNVVLSPHHASGTEQTRDAMGALLVANLDAWFEGKPLLSQVV
jgi:lactate dehydrogenase-like 2-hydroxyacid dehydrogenase